MDLGPQIAVGNRPKDFHSFPDNWQLRSLGEITTSSQYGISSSLGGNYSVPILKMNNLQDGRIDLGDLDYIQLSKAEMESLILNKGDLLINRTNSLDLVGKAAIYDLAGEYVFASYLVRFRLGPSVLPAFVNYFLNSEPGQSKLKLLATKAVSQANINPSILKKRLFVPIPPLIEQHRIVEILCALDLSINLTTQLIAKKCDIKQATMQQLLTGKTRLPGFSGQLKPSHKQTEVEEIPVGWNSYKFVQIATIRKEKVDPKRIGRYSFCIELEHIGQGSGQLIGHSTITEESSLKARFNIGDVLFGRLRAYLRKYWLADRDGVCSTEIWPLVAHGNVVTEQYLFQLVQTNQFIEAASSAYGTHMPRTDWGVIKNYEVSLPSLNEQTAIATILSDMDAEITALEQKRDKTRALKQGMMQELLTGKTRLL